MQVREKNTGITSSPKRINDIPVIVEWLKQMEVGKIIDHNLSKPHGNHQGLIYGQLSVFALRAKRASRASQLCKVKREN